MESKRYNILVTGGCGFIGWNFLKLLFKEDLLPFNKVVNLDILNYAATNATHEPYYDDRYTFVRGNITTDTVYKILNKHKIDLIVHFAAQTHVCNSIEGPRPFLESNIFGTYNLLEEARYFWNDEKIEGKFILVSTDEVYGSVEDQGGKAFTEETPYHPNNPYSASKAAADHIAKAYFNTYNFPVIVTNCSNNYGPGQHTEKLIPKIIDSCVNWTDIPLHGDGTHQRDWVFVEDHCKGIARAITYGKNGESYLFGTHKNLQNIEIADYICDYFDKTTLNKASHHTLKKFVTDRPGYDKTYLIDYSKSRRDLGWEPLISVYDGLEKTIESYIINNYKEKMQSRVKSMDLPIHI